MPSTNQATSSSGVRKWRDEPALFSRAGQWMLYRFPPDGFPDAPPLPWVAKGEAGTASLGLSFLGFFASRLLRCSPLAMACLRFCQPPR
jgi:hypothetical protein